MGRATILRPCLSESQATRAATLSILAAHSRLHARSLSVASPKYL